ncbi:MAG: HEAT repeat protein [Planctomycetota bacterium]|jgi:HEAT repeat protein
MTRILILVLTLAALTNVVGGLGVLCIAQVELSKPANPAIVKLLTSPYAAERKIGVKSLLALAEKHWEEESFLDPWLNHSSELVRLGAANVAAQDLDASRAVKKIKAVIKKEKLTTRRQELANIAFGAAFNGWDGTVDYFDDKEENDEFAAAALHFVRVKLSALANSGTQTTNYRAVGKLASLGPYSIPVLEKIASESGEGLYQRGLALSALARMNSRSFWVNDDGTLSAKTKKMLDDGPEYLKINTLFSMAYFGTVDKTSVKAMSNFVLQDAYSAETIQGGLYYLYTLPDKEAQAEQQYLAQVAKEYLDGSYAQKVRFHAGVLLARINVATLASQAIEMIKESPDFAGYWAMGAVLNRANDLPEADRAKTISDLIGWVLASENCAPQLKGTALWHLRQKGTSFPKGVTVEKVTTAIHASMEKVHMASEDPSYLAIRGGLDILAYLKDPKVDEAILKNLKHESEAVRMAAALAAGNTGHKALIPKLYKAMNDDHEFAAYGAAWALNQLGDKRARLWFARYMLNGNACLMRSCLGALRTATGLKVGEIVPTDPKSWRVRGRAWISVLKKNATR